MTLVKNFFEGCKKLGKKEKRTLYSISLALLAIAFVSFAETPGFVAVSAAAKQLPIYCVERDQKMVSISFDAAWGNDFCGNTLKALILLGL